MAARLEGRHNAVNQKHLSKNQEIFGGFSPPGGTPPAHVNTAKFIIPFRARALGLAGRAFLCALRSATCAATTAIPSTPFTRGLKEAWAKFLTRSRRIGAPWSRLQAVNHCCRR